MSEIEILSELKVEPGAAGFVRRERKIYGVKSLK
jgi:hypothetical protein